MRFDWEKIGRETFDGVVEALLRRVYRRENVQVFDGAGGDGGRDVVVSLANGQHFYQLKYFPGRISAKNPKRRSQVESSLKAAAKRQPKSWTLVVPGTLNQNEHAWFDKLRAAYDFPLHLWDKAALDERMAEHADLGAYFKVTEADYLLEAVKAYRAESAVLASREDLACRVASLRGAAAAQDKDWRWDFALLDGVETYLLRPQHAMAQEVSPIRIDLDLSLADLEGGDEIASKWPPFWGTGRLDKCRCRERQYNAFRSRGRPWYPKTRATWRSPSAPSLSMPLNNRYDFGSLARRARFCILFAARPHGRGAGPKAGTLKVMCPALPSPSVGKEGQLQCSVDARDGHRRASRRRGLPCSAGCRRHDRA